MTGLLLNWELHLTNYYINNIVFSFHLCKIFQLSHGDPTTVLPIASHLLCPNTREVTFNLQKLNKSRYKLHMHVLFINNHKKQFILRTSLVQMKSFNKNISFIWCKSLILQITRTACSRFQDCGKILVHLHAQNKISLK